VPRKRTAPLPRDELFFRDFDPGAFLKAKRTAADIVQRHKSTAKLRPQKRDRLAEDIAYALTMCPDLRLWLRGKRTKPIAWALDLVTLDLMDAYVRAGLKLSVRADNSGQSDFLVFGKLVTSEFKLKGAGATLFNNALRARKMQRCSWMKNS